MTASNQLQERIAACQGAAASLIESFNAPAQAHAVWIKTEVEGGEFSHVLCVAIRPEWESKIEVPSEQDGVPVRVLSWKAANNIDREG